MINTEGIEVEHAYQEPPIDPIKQRMLDNPLAWKVITPAKLPKKMNKRLSEPVRSRATAQSTQVSKPFVESKPQLSTQKLWAKGSSLADNLRILKSTYPGNGRV